MLDRRLLAGLLVAATSSSLACSGGCGGTPGVVIADGVRVVDDQTSKAVGVADGRLTFPAAGNEWLLDLPAGSVLVSGYKAGFLRKTVEATREGDTIVVTTTQAKLTDAIVQGKVEARLDVPREFGAGAALSSPLSFDRNFDDTQLVSTPGLEVKVSQGRLAFSPSLDLGIAIEDSALESFSLTGTGAVSATLAVKATAGSSFSKEGEVVLLEAGPYYFTQFIGTVPVVEEVNLTLTLQWKAEGSAQVSVEAGASAAGSVTLGARFDDGVWSPVAQRSLAFQTVGPTVEQELKLKLSAAIVAQVDTRFYAVAGPYVNLQPRASFEMTLAPEPPKWELKGGVTSELGASLEILGVELAEYNTTLFSYEESLASHVSHRDGGVADAAVPSVDAGQDDAGTAAADAGSAPDATAGPADTGAHDAGPPTPADGGEVSDTGVDPAYWPGLTKVLHYKFDEGQGTAVEDQSPLANDAVLYSTASWAPGRCLFALESPTDGYAAGTPSIDLALNTAPNFTIAFWLQFLGHAPSYASYVWTIFFWDDYFVGACNWGIKLREDEYGVDLEGWPIISQMPGGSVYDGAWHHVVVVRTPSVYTWYLDGAPVATGAAGIPWDPQACAIGAAPLFNIGSLAHKPTGNNNQSQHFRLDELRIYRDALTPEAIAALHAHPCTVP